MAKRSRKPSRKRQVRRRGKTRRRQAVQARGAVVNLKDQIPGYLFSAGEFAQANGAAYLPALFAEIPEDEILAALPRPRRRKRGPGRPPFPRRAMVRALFARQAYAIPSYAQLEVRLKQDAILKAQCGFDMAKPSPDESSLGNFAQFLGEHVGALQRGQALLVDELGEHLPGLGEHTSWDTAYLPLYVPEPVEEPAACTEDQGADSAPAKSKGPAGEPGDGPSSVTKEEEESRARSSSSRSRAKRKSKSRSKSKSKFKFKSKSQSKSKSTPKKSKEQSPPSPAGLEADWGKKTYESVSPKSVTLTNGETVEGIEVKKSSSWVYGGKMALITDNRWHLPLLTGVDRASRADGPMIPPMYRDLTQQHGWMECAYAMIDKAGDSQEVHEALLEELGIVGIIPLRQFANGEAPAEADQEFAKTVYDRERVTHLHHPQSGEYVEFEPWGYDASRQAVKYVCPCRNLRASGDLAADASCPFMGAQCRARHGDWPFSFWVPMSTNYRYYCPVPRESERWATLYKERTTVERVNSVIKGPLGLGERRLRCLATAACEAVLASVFLCARAMVAVRWGVLDKVGSAVSALEPRPPYRATG